MNLKSIFGYEAIFLAVVSSFGYWLSYLFQLGYCRHFAIPHYFIEIQIENIISAILGIISLLLILAIYYNYVYLFLRSRTKGRLRAETLEFIMALIPVFILIDISVRGIFILKGFDSPYKPFASAISSVIAVLVTYAWSGLRNVIFTNSSRAPKNLTVFFFAVCIISYGIYTTGVREAILKENFIVLKEDYVVLLKYKDKFLVASINRKAREVSTEFELVNIDSNLLMSVERVGILKTEFESGGRN